MKLAFVAWIGVAVLACGRRNFNVDGDVPDHVPMACDTPPPNCPSAIVYACNGKCYVTCDASVPRTAAAVVCRDWGGCLADPSSIPDNDCAASHAPGNSWIAPIQDENSSQPADNWRRCDGSLLSFDQWGTGHPDDETPPEDGLEQCAFISPGGAWDDDVCGNPHSFVCNRPL